MVTFGLNIYRQEKTSVNANDYNLKTIELEGYMGILHIRNDADNQHISVPIGSGDLKKVYEAALEHLKAIQEDIDTMIGIVENHLR